MKINKKSILFISIILCFTFICMCLSACTWEDFKNKAKDVLDNLVAVDDNGNDMLNGETYEMPSAMTFRGASGSSKNVTLTASVFPSSAVDKTVAWSVSWLNGSSSWATGKTVTEYVTVSPVSSGALSATVRCLKPFGEKIKISVASTVNPDAKAECTVDYLRDFDDVSYVISDSSDQSVTLTFSNSGVVGKFSCFGRNARDPYDSTEKVLPNTCSLSGAGSVYTISDVIDSARVYIKLSDVFVTKLLANTDFKGDAYSFNGKTEYFELTNEATHPVNRNDTSYVNSPYISVVDFFSAFGAGYLTSVSNTEGTTYSDYYNPMIASLRETSGPHFTVKIVANCSISGERTFEYGMRFSDSSLGLVAASLSLNSSSLLF